MSGWRPNVLLKCHTPKIQTPGLPLKPAAPQVSLSFVNGTTTYSSARKILQAFFPFSLFSYYVWCIGMACFFQIHPDPNYFLSMPPLPAWLWYPSATDLCTVVSALNVWLLLSTSSVYSPCKQQWNLENIWSKSYNIVLFHFESNSNPPLWPLNFFTV